VKEKAELFVESVCDAIESVHDILGKAHCDIRLENICWRNRGQQEEAVLIDLDRTILLDGPAKFYKAEYTSVMYEVDEAFTARNVDWHQFGVLIIYVKEDCEDYHSIKIGDDARKAAAELFAG
jgi:hypothetical protein